MIMTIALGFVSYEYILRTMPMPLAAEWLGAMSVNAAQLSQSNRVFFVLYALLQIPIGMVIDQRGAKLWLKAGSLCCAAGCILLALAPNFFLMVVARTLLTLGGATATLCCFKLAINWLPSRCFGSICGVVGAISMLCAWHGSQLIQQASTPHWVIWLLQMGALGLMIALLTHFVLLDAPMQRSPHLSRYMATTCRNLMRVLCTPSVWLCGIAMGLSFIPFSALGLQWGTSYLELSQQLNKHHATLITKLLFAGGMVGCIGFGLASDCWKNRKKTYLTGMVLAVTIMLYITLIKQHSNFTMGMLWFLLGMFCACGVLCFVIAKEAVPLSMGATTLAVVNTIMLSVGAGAQWLMTSLLTIHHSQHHYLVHTAVDYHRLFLLLPAGLVAAIMAIYFTNNNQVTQQPAYSQVETKPQP